MKLRLTTIIAALSVIFSSAVAHAEAVVGSPAPDFTAQTATGKTIKLSQYKGKIVVLEWHNPGCPFVKKFYNVGQMQSYQTAAKDKGVVWLTVNSGAEGKQGYVDATAATAYVAEQKASPAEYLLDSAGMIGKLYGAKTTPHMFVIDTTGMVAYAGAIDSDASANSDAIAGATNYVNAAIEALMAGKTPEPASTQAYGCSVKY